MAFQARARHDNDGSVILDTRHHEAGLNCFQPEQSITRMLVEYIVCDPCLVKQRTDEAEQDGIVGSDEFTHKALPDPFGGDPRAHAPQPRTVQRQREPVYPLHAIAQRTFGDLPLGRVISMEEARESADLQSLLDIVAEDMQAINRIILDKAVSDVEMIPELAHHLIDSGGKRLRPMLTIAAAKLVRYGGTGHIRVASAVEFMHTATLLHDDVVDESATRRGRKTARMIWGNQASVLVGDFLLGQAFRMLVEVGSLPVLKIMSNAAATIAEGEVMQLAAAKNTATTEDEYLAIINAKTAALFSAAAEVSPALAKQPAEEQSALKSYGKNLGLAFQLVDDALDYAGDSARLGKSTGDDFREGKITLPVILSFRRGSTEERAFWNRTIVEGEIKDGDLEHAIALMKRHKAIEATMDRARSYGAIARDALAIFPDSREKASLEKVISFCVNRSH